MRVLIMFFLPLSLFAMSQAEADEIWRKAMEESERIGAERSKEKNDEHRERQPSPPIKVLTEAEAAELNAEREAAARIKAEERRSKVVSSMKEKYGIDPSFVPLSASQETWGQATNAIPERWHDSYFLYKPGQGDGQARVRVAASFTISGSTVRVLTDTGEITVAAGRVYELRGDGITALWLPDVKEDRWAGRGLLLLRNNVVSLQFPGYDRNGALDYHSLRPYVVAADLAP
jgi:hypothetical protein